MKRGRKQGTADTVFIRIEEFLQAGYSPKFPVKVSRKWMEDIGFKVINAIEPIEVTAVIKESGDEKVEFEIHQ
jgi:hypothetical protein